MCLIVYDAKQKANSQRFWKLYHQIYEKNLLRWKEIVGICEICKVLKVAFYNFEFIKCAFGIFDMVFQRSNPWSEKLNKEKYFIKNYKIYYYEIDLQALSIGLCIVCINHRSSLVSVWY